MADRTVAVVLQAKVGGLVSGFQTAGKAAQDFGSRTLGAVSRNQASISKLSNTLGVFGLAAVGAAGLAVKSFADFDQSMSNVAATGADAASNLAALRDAALDAGRETAYSAKEAAGGIEELLKAGVSAQDVLGGGLTGALSLAASGELEVGEAAEIAATAMTQFGLGGEQVNHVADLLSAGAAKAQGGVSDLGMALKQSGLVADQTGLSIEETTAGLTAFAAAGLVGSDAGTSFKSMLQRLTPQSEEAKDMMDELGISAYDSQGGFVGLAEFAGSLQTALKDLTPEQRNSALATIFGTDAVRAAAVVYENGEQGIRDWISAVDDQGFAAETAATRLDNLNGDLKILQGSVETALIALGEGADGPLRSMVQNVTDMVNAFSDAPTSVQNVTLALVGGGGMVALGIAGMGKLVVGISEVKTALATLKISARTAGTAIGIAGAALAVGGFALSKWAENAAEAKARTEEFQSTLDEFGNVTDDTLSIINDGLSKNITPWVDSIFGADPESLIDKAEEFGLSVEDLQGYILGEADAVERVNEVTSAYIEAHSSSASTTQAAKMHVDGLTKGLDEQSSALTGAQKAAAQKQIADEAAGVGADDLTDSIDGTTAAVEAQIPSLEELIDLQSKAAGIVLSERDAQRAFQAAIDDATASLDENGQTLDITTEAGRKNQAALDDISKAGWDVVESMQANGATQDELKASMATTREAFIKAAKAMGMGAEDAARLADEMGLIPEKVSVPVSVDTTVAEQRLAAFKALLKMPDIVVTAEMRTSGGYYANRAEGGIVYGPGTATSDSIPARLSNGEYVIKAASVSRYGKSMFDDLNAQRFSTGGYVSHAAPTQSTGGSQRTAPLIGSVTLTAGDSSDVIRRLGSEVSWQMMRSGAGS
ncbi:phage tail tape measure protein [Actinotalea sp.]|uniref:phage tail tape measure protein n=1 Tax=Actinotalea sp. TaxID=1872145 RepID=UPI003564F7AA